jgi:uncharacterized protein
MPTSSWTANRFEGAEAFLERAGDWLTESEAEHNLLLGITRQLQEDGHPYEDPILLATLERNGAIGGCVFRTPPFMLGVTRLPEDAVGAAVQLASEVYPSLPAVMGPTPTVDAVAKSWAGLRGVGTHVALRMRVHQLAQLLPGTKPSRGALRLAQASDLDTVVRWLEAFQTETHVQALEPLDFAEARMAEGELFVWDDQGPRAMAAGVGRTPTGMRIGMVYTPPDNRRAGYATSCVATLSQRYLDDGFRSVFLYTDLANPTSNSIYPRIGFRPVADVNNIEFVS